MLNIMGITLTEDNTPIGYNIIFLSDSYINVLDKAVKITKKGNKYYITYKFNVYKNSDKEDIPISLNRQIELTNIDSILYDVYDDLKSLFTNYIDS